MARANASQRERAAEGRVWPVVAALVISALLGTLIGWLFLSRGPESEQSAAAQSERVEPEPDASSPSPNSEGRQQLLNRLRALQIDRTWFLKLVDSSWLSRFPERGGRLPSDSMEDAPLRQVWDDLSEEWLARVEQLPPGIRARLGQLDNKDWEQHQQHLIRQNVHPRVIQELVTAAARNVLPGDVSAGPVEEPYRQLWIAAAIETLKGISIDTIAARSGDATTRSLRVSSGGARLIAVTVPAESSLVLGINGTPLMEMTVFGSQGQVLAARGPLRVVSLPSEAGSPVQVLVVNDGVASGVLTLSCRADAPLQPQKVQQPDVDAPEMNEAEESDFDPME
jgi:serine/threonine-protein kinase